MANNEEKRTVGHISAQILNITCPICGYGFATAAHEYYLEDRSFESDILCANDDCTYFKEAVVTGTSGSTRVMKKVLKLYLEDS